MIPSGQGSAHPQKSIHGALTLFPDIPWSRSGKGIVLFQASDILNLALMQRLQLCCLVRSLPGPEKPQPLVGQRNGHGEAEPSDGADREPPVAPFQAGPQPRAVLPPPAAHGVLSTLQTDTRRCGSHPKQLPAPAGQNTGRAHPTSQLCEPRIHRHVPVTEPRNCSPVSHLACQASPHGFHRHWGEVGVLLGFITVLHTDVQ